MLFFTTEKLHSWFFQYYGKLEKLEFEQKVPDMHRQRWKTGDWTDDTDQLILIMQSLLANAGEVRYTPPVCVCVCGQYDSQKVWRTPHNVMWGMDLLSIASNYSVGLT